MVLESVEMVASLVTLCERVFDDVAHCCDWLKLRPRLDKLLEKCYRWTIDHRKLDFCLKYMFKVLT